MLILMHTSGLSEKFYKVFKITFIVSLLKSFYTENDISQILAKISYFILRMISVKYQPKTNIIKRFIFLTANKCPNTKFFLVHIFPYSVRIWTLLSQCLLLIEAAFKYPQKLLNHQDQQQSIALWDADVTRITFFKANLSHYSRKTKSKIKWSFFFPSKALTFIKREITGMQSNINFRCFELAQRAHTCSKSTIKTLTLNLYKSPNH